MMFSPWTGLNGITFRTFFFSLCVQPEPTTWRRRERERGMWNKQILNDYIVVGLLTWPLHGSTLASWSCPPRIAHSLENNYNRFVSEPHESDSCFFFRFLFFPSHQRATFVFVPVIQCSVLSTPYEVRRDPKLHESEKQINKSIESPASTARSMSFQFHSKASRHVSRSCHLQSTGRRHRWNGRKIVPTWQLDTLSVFLLVINK